MINTIIFDFAGVITKETFLPVLSRNLNKEFGIDESFFKQRFLENEIEYETGRMSDELFWQITCQGFHISFNDYKRIFATSFELNLEVIEYIKELKSNYDIVLLSDSFDILAQALRKDEAFMSLFSKTFFSNEIGLVKKDVNCFKYTLQELGKEPAECIFIDDKESNLLQARSLDIACVHFQTASQLKKELSAAGIAFNN